ncbi:LysR family transcriptional regulator [Sphingomonas sp. MA1305]|uniref:LysR substrate-binding domain-containing protein n=1 Tax=Sphingomonas sp. MA1305 TaxID=2479204 RepID=UPI0018DFA5ED|nr:LysR substrate-binding domain-containing protein [Sphingomonas sp. MA1305]MBI0476348.1 LysR family transcriptional regulator [Sphingomonas sp. MA1305]
MELRHLRYFVQVAEDLHFARAAARLGISQPPLSLQIRQLEEDIGVRLLERTSRRVTLTPAGSVFLDAAKRALAEAERGVALARAAARGELGGLRVGFNASAPFIPKVALAINAYRRLFPEVQLALSEVVGHAQIEAIAAGELDVGFLRSATPPGLPAELTATRILEERLMVATNPDNPLAGRPDLRLADAAAHPLVVYGNDRGGGFTEELFALIRAGGLEPNVAQSVSEVSTLLGLVAAGVGIAVVAKSLCALQSASLVYTELVDEGMASSVWLVHAISCLPTATAFAAIVNTN